MQILCKNNQYFKLELEVKSECVDTKNLYCIINSSRVSPQTAGLDTDGNYVTSSDEEDRSDNILFTYSCEPGMQSDPNFDIKFVLYLNENKFAGLDFDDVEGLTKQKQIDLLAT